MYPQRTASKMPDVMLKEENSFKMGYFKKDLFKKDLFKKIYLNPSKKARHNGGHQSK